MNVWVNLCKTVPASNMLTKPSLIKEDWEELSGQPQRLIDVKNMLVCSTTKADRCEEMPAYSTPTADRCEKNADLFNHNG